MGGTALKLIKTRRYSIEEYEQLLPEILDRAKKLFRDASAITFFKDKKDFGDMDVLVLMDSKGLSFDYTEMIQLEFNPKQISRNDNVISFEYKDFQIDFVLTKEEFWETSKTYYSYNDLSNYIGKIANQFGLKYAVQGLKFQQNGFDIIISQDNDKILEFLGFDFVRYNNGFNNMSEIYQFVIDSKYFDPKFYLLENLSKGQRDRDSRRNNYMDFLKVIDTLEEKERSYFHIDKTVYLGLVDYFFPGLLQKIQSVLDKIKFDRDRKMKINSLYNGLLLRSVFGISGLELGYSMKKFRESFGSQEEMESYILSTDDKDLILKKFKEITLI